MNKKGIFTVMAVAAVLLFVSPAYAHYVYLDPSGEISGTPGETVTVDVYLHADTADTLYGWGLNIGFDDAANDGLELSSLSFEYGSETLAAHGTDEGVGYLAGASNVSAGEGVFHAGRYDWGFVGDSLSAGQDYLLFSVDFTLVGGLWDGDDVWVEWGHAYPNESYFDMDTGFYDNLTVESGPDYAAVPIPSALLLFGSGIIGFMGLRRRNN